MDVLGQKLTKERLQLDSRRSFPDQTGRRFIVAVLDGRTDGRTCASSEFARNDGECEKAREAVGGRRRLAGRDGGMRTGRQRRREWTKWTKLKFAWRECRTTDWTELCSTLPRKARARSCSACLAA